MQYPVHADLPAQATALMRRKPRLNAHALCDAINALLGDGAPQLSVVETAAKGTICLGSAHACVTFVPGRRLPRAQVSGALASPATKARAHDHARDYDAHAASVAVEVDHGEAGVETPLSLAARLGLLKVALEALCAGGGVSAVHWDQSDMIFSPDDIKAAIGIHVPVNMVVHPLPILAQPGSDGTARSGLIAHGSDLLLGPLLCIDPLPLDVPALINLAHVILYQHDAGHIDLDHGDTLITRDGITLFVRHAGPCAQWPMGRICIGTTRPRQDSAPAKAAASRPATSDFQDRIGRLKRQAPTPATPAPDDEAQIAPPKSNPVPVRPIALGLMLVALIGWGMTAGIGEIAADLTGFSTTALQTPD